MEQARIPFQKILFVCVNQRAPDQMCCANQGSEAITASLKARIKELGMSRVVRVSKSGCQDLCAKGPNVMVFPGDVWYRGVTLDDVERIIQDTIRDLPKVPTPSTSPTS